MQARYSPPGAAAPRPGRPPHTVGRRNASSILPTRRGRSAAGPTSPHGGEAKCKLDTPHPASPLRGLADLPTRWGGECKLDTPHPASPLRGLADLPTRRGGKMQARYAPPGEPAARAGRPPHTVGRRKCKLDTPHPASPLRGLA